jgi:hypothetical protein
LRRIRYSRNFILLATKLHILFQPAAVDGILKIPKLMLRRIQFWLLLSAVSASGQVIELPPPPALRFQPPLVWDQTYRPMSLSEKLQYHYIQKMVGPWGLFTASYATAMDQMQVDPVEWAHGGDGLGQRFAARLGTRLVRRSIRLGIEQFSHEDPRFFRSGKTGFLPRAKSVLLQTVQVRKEDGGTTFPYGRVIGAFAAAQISQAWYPESRRGFAANMQRGAFVLLGDVGTRMLREFWPDIWRTLSFKRSANPEHPKR